jgi:hypothetical protein
MNIAPGVLPIISVSYYQDGYIVILSTLNIYVNDVRTIEPAKVLVTNYKAPNWTSSSRAATDSRYSLIGSS